MLKLWFTSLIIWLSFLLASCSSGNRGFFSSIATSTTSVTTNLTNSSAKMQIPLLVILTQFNNVKLKDTEATWANKIFSMNDGKLNHYFSEVSNRKIQFQPAKESQGTHNNGVVIADLSINHPSISQYLISSKGNIQTPIKSSLSKIDPYIDFSKYDTDNSKHISSDELQIMFIVAGGEAAIGDSPPTTWGHAACLGNFVSAPIHDKVTLISCTFGGVESRYTAFGEQQKGHAATIGIIAHELGHSAFNLPDLYDFDNSSAGIGYWGLMGAGSWTKKNSDLYVGQTPVHPTGWSKIKMGIMQPITITTGATSITYTAYEHSNANYKIFKIPIPSTGTNTKEYFLIENRNNIGYDLGLQALKGTYSGGLLISHIDDSRPTNNSDTLRLVDIEEANNPGLDANQLANGRHNGHANNLFFSGNSSQFTDTTTPNSKNKLGQKTGISITNIGNRGPSISFDVTFQ